MISYKIGINKNTRELIFIQDANKGLSCGCICADCGKNFVAVKGQKNEWHFRHFEESNCKGGQETALHLLAKRIISKNSKINLPYYGEISYENATEEIYFTKFIPDVTAIVNGEKMFFEVRVTHAVDSRKEDFYKKGKHKSIEIDLKDYHFTSYEHLENRIINEIESKKIIYWENPNIEKEGVDIRIILFGILLFLGFSIFACSVDNKRKSKRF